MLGLSVIVYLLLGLLFLAIFVLAIVAFSFANRVNEKADALLYTVTQTQGQAMNQNNYNYNGQGR